MVIEEKIIGELVAEDFRNAHVFSKYGIDFCCGGKKTLSEACRNAEVDSQIIVLELEKVLSTGEREELVGKLSPSELIDYIVSTHHTYTREKGELLLQYSSKMVRAHGERHPEVMRLFELIQSLMDDLLPHLLKEEKVLFPAIVSIQNQTSLNFPKEQIVHPIDAMESEHNAVGHLIQDLISLTNHFSPPEYACTTWKICYATLAEYVIDLQTHIHLENNVLFPKVLRII